MEALWIWEKGTNGLPARYLFRIKARRAAAAETWRPVSDRDRGREAGVLTVPGPEPLLPVPQGLPGPVHVQRDR